MVAAPGNSWDIKHPKNRKRAKPMRRIVSAGLLSALTAISFGAGANAEPRIVERSGDTYHVAVCGKVVGLVARCFAHLVTDQMGHMLFGKATTIGGYTPSQLRSAYKIEETGKPSTIMAIVDAYGYPNAEADLAVYRSEFGLPPCTTANGCFKKLNQTGLEKSYPVTNSGWDVEQALDVDMASAMCPRCTIYLIQAKTASFQNLGTAVNEAAKLGAHVISNSYGADETAAMKSFAPYYDHPGIAITVANGDDGYGVESPADMNTVIAVGGTRLNTDDTPRGWTESVWSGSGSGCSTVFAKAAWQKKTGCSMRIVGDTAAVADPDTGVAIYDAGWGIVGGTSVATPLVGGIFAVTDGIVNAASSIYAHPADLYPVTTGSDGTCSPAYLCNGEVGYNAPTGLGTPRGTGAF
jgi:subtilase family serine protease